MGTPDITPAAEPRILALRLSFRVPKYVAGARGKGRFLTGYTLEHRAVNDVIDEPTFAACYARDVNRLAGEFKAGSAKALASQFGVGADELVFTGVSIAWHEVGERVAPEQWV